jgi:glutathione synthase
MKQHIFITDSFASLQANHDSSLAMMREALVLGHKVFQAEISDLSGIEGEIVVQSNECYLENRLVKLVEDSGILLSLSKSSEFVVWMRKDPPVDEEYIQACQLLRLCKCLVYNNPNSLMACNEKLLALEFPDLIPQTLITSNIKRIIAEVKSKKKLVAKPVAGKAGEGILVLNEGDKNISSILEMMTERGRRKIIIQEFLPEIKNGDKRIFLLAGEPIGALTRLPNSTDNRANMAAGGSTQPAVVTPLELQICSQLKPRLLELGLIVVGLDVIGDKVTEINITSPTCLEEIAVFNSSNPAKQIIEWVC